MLGKIISVRPQLIQKVTDQAAHSYTHRIPARTQIVLHISLKIKSHEEHQELQAGISQQNLQAQALFGSFKSQHPLAFAPLHRLSLTTLIKVTHTHAHPPLPPFVSLLQASRISKKSILIILLWFSLSQNSSIFYSTKSLKDRKLFICLPANPPFAEDFPLEHLQEQPG